MFTLFVLVFIVSLVPSNCSWSKPIELFANNESITTCIGLYIEPSTQIHHVVFHSWHLDRVFYLKLTPAGNVIENRTFSHPDMSFATLGNIQTSDNGKRIHLLLSGQKKSDREHFGLWYTESPDQGHTWTNVISVVDQNDKYSREGSAMVALQENSRVFVFFSCVEEVSPFNKRTVIKMASKPPNSSLFTREVSIQTIEPGMEVRNALTAEYTTKNNKPLLHLVWATGFSQPGEINYMSSQDYGVTWTTPLKISGNEKIYPYNTIESTSNRDFPAVFAGIYTEFETNKKRVYVTKDNGNTFAVLDASLPEKSPFDGSMHREGLGLCGSKDRPIIYMLIDRQNAEMTYSMFDLTTMKITSLPRPFKEFGTDSYGITLACAYNAEKKETTISAITEVGYGKETRRLLMTTEVSKISQVETANS